MKTLLISLFVIAVIAVAQITTFPPTGGGGGGGGTPKAVLAYQSAPQAIPGSYTTANLSFDTNDASTTNTPSMHSTTVNPDQFHVPSDGFYEGACAVYSDSTAISGPPGATEILLTVSVNGTAVGNPGRQPTTTATSALGYSVPFFYFMHAADVVTCSVATSEGWNTNVGLGGTQFYMHSVN